VTLAAAERDVQTQAPARVRLYVAGRSPNSVAALANLRAALAASPELGLQLEVVDVLVDPERALRDGVFVTPMLVKSEPAPERRILGTLRDQAMLREMLGVEDAAHA
jgi:circadian clock protein KaiB